MVVAETVGALLRSVSAGSAGDTLADRTGQGISDAIAVAAQQYPLFTLVACLVTVTIIVLGGIAIQQYASYKKAVHKEKMDPVYRQLAQMALTQLTQAKTITKTKRLTGVRKR